jgi:hypothetical protein
VLRSSEGRRFRRAKYDADQARIGQFYRSHGIPRVGGLTNTDKLSFHELASFANVLRDEIRNSRELVALSNSESENGCLNVQTDKSMTRWFAAAAGWIGAAMPALATYDRAIEAPLAQKHGGGAPPMDIPADRDNHWRRERALKLLEPELDVLVRQRDAAWMQEVARREALARTPIPRERLKVLIVLAHPDRHNGSKMATETTQWLLAQRGRKAA